MVYMYADIQKKRNPTCKDPLIELPVDWIDKLNWQVNFFVRKEGHIPCRVAYHISDVMRDLLNFAAKFLRDRGRLVYWLPVDREE